MRLRSFLRLGILPIVACGMLSAQDVDPPSRVARLNYLSGSVSFRPASVEDWTGATLNYPLTTGDHLWTDRDSGAEIHVGAAVLHLADQTAFAILNLDDKMAQFSVTQGALNINLPRLGQDETFEVDTPNGAIVLLRTGSYRVDVNGDANSSALVVRTGEAEVTGGGQALAVHPREMLRFSGADQLSTETLAMPGGDEFDRWCLDRDAREARALEASARYVPPDMIGAGDLGDHGVWRTDPQYGAVWVPAGVPGGWAPYRYGHWAYIRPWGWTWIDDMPWGFAPFHYGRWAMTPAGWVWVPGAMVARPVYAPALVTFVGGGGFSMAIGVGGGVGVAAWIPLGPHEVFRPYYHVSDVYVRNVNVTHVTNVNVVNVTNVTYVNRTYVTAVPQATFAGARPVAGAAVRVPPGAVERAQVVSVAEVRPAREAYMGRAAQPGQRFGAPPPQVMQRQVVVKTAPPPSVRPMGGVRVAAPAPAVGTRPAMSQPPSPEGRQFGRPANAGGPAPQPQMQNSAPPRNDRPPSIYGGRPANQPVNQQPTNAQPANPRPSNPVTPQPESVHQPRNETPRNETPRNEQVSRPQIQQSTPSQPQHQPRQEQRDQRKQQSNRRKEDDKKQ